MERKREKGTERYLDYMPLCIYLKFEKAVWRAHPKLEACVYPLYPVERTWELNDNSKAKIRRRGFPLSPNYASTAFMIQGSTLSACLADCGDILDRTGFSEFLTAYVILSRVINADGLLLLRAFSPELFAIGPPPGAHCLLRLLRRIFQCEERASAQEMQFIAQRKGAAQRTDILRQTL